MKIYVLGSNSFVETMVACKDKLCSLGHEGWIHPDYEDHVKGKKRAFPENEAETSDFKKAHDYIRQHYKHICDSDAVLIVNLEKKGIRNYIGGNCLIEMGQAHVHNKKIYFLNGMPEHLPYMDEIRAMDPICLEGDLKNITA